MNSALKKAQDQATADLARSVENTEKNAKVMKEVVEKWDGVLQSLEESDVELTPAPTALPIAK